MRFRTHQRDFFNSGGGPSWAILRDSATLIVLGLGCAGPRYVTKRYTKGGWLEMPYCTFRAISHVIAPAATRRAEREGARARARCPAAGAAAAVCRRPALPGSPAAARRRRWGSSTCQCCGIDICSDQSGAVRAPQQACHPQLFRARPQPAIGPPPHLLGLEGNGCAIEALPPKRSRIACAFESARFMSSWRWLV